MSKEKLDCWKPSTRNKGGAFKSFANNGKGGAALLRWLPEEGHAVAEATGGYERLLVAACHDLGAPVSVANPKGVRDLARAHGQPAKTDRRDAESIARFAEAVRPEPLPKPAEAQRELAVHVDLREGPVADRTAQLNRLGKEASPSLRTHLRSVIARLEKTIAKLERQIEALIASRPRMAPMRGELTKTPGVGTVISSTPIALLPELGTLSRKEAAALCGLAPYARDSGQKKGKRFIAGGRAKLRRRLYMGAVSAVRARTPLRTQYKRPCSKGASQRSPLSSPSPANSPSAPAPSADHSPLRLTLYDHHRKKYSCSARHRAQHSCAATSKSLAPLALGLPPEPARSQDGGEHCRLCSLYHSITELA